MEAFAAILRRIQSFCAERHVEHLAMAHVRPCWFSDLLKLAGFKDCECELPSKRLGTIGAGLQLCMVLPSQPTESPTVIGAERSHVGNASILLDQEDRAHLAVPSAVTALKDLIADFPRRPPTDHTRRKMPAEIAADRNHFGNASMSLDQEDHAYLAVPPAVTAPESLTADFPRLPSPDHTQRKMPAFIGSDRSQFGNAYMLLDREDYAHSVAPPEVTAPKGLRADFPRRPSPDQTEKKGYCMFWLRRGECDYMQKGCRYLHEMPVDKETREKIGLRKIPEW